MKNSRDVIYHAQCDPTKHHRRSIRLKGYDYSRKGAYFVTIRIHGKRYLFSRIQNGQTFLTKYGHTAEKCWCEIPGQFKDVELDKFVIMPNHIHGVLFLYVRAPFIVPSVGAQFIAPNKLGLDKSSPYIKNNPMVLNETTLGKIIRSFKARTTHQIRNVTNLLRFKWQRNYYEHIIRNEDELNKIREYIQANPLKWQFDRENPDRIEDKVYQDQWKWPESGHA